MEKRATETPFWNNGLRFACTQCSHCCRHESGYVYLTEADLDRLVAWKGISRSTFLREYTRWAGHGQWAVLSLVETDQFDCVFWKDGGCSVYQARPTQCRTYPFWQHAIEDSETWAAEARSCPGIGAGPLRSAREIEDALAARTASAPLMRGDIEL